METTSSVADLAKYCRLCATKTTTRNRLNIFQDDGQHTDMHVKIATCLPVVVTETDTLPKSMCINCANKLDAFYEFRELTLSSESFLYNLIDRPNITNSQLSNNLCSIDKYSKVNKSSNCSKNRRVKQPIEFVSCVIDDVGSDSSQHPSSYEFEHFSNPSIKPHKGNKICTTEMNTTNKNIIFSKSLLKDQSHREQSTQRCSLLKNITAPTALPVPHKNDISSEIVINESNSILNLDNPSEIINNKPLINSELHKSEVISRSILKAKYLLEQSQNQESRKNAPTTSNSVESISLLQCSKCHIFFLPSSDVNHICEGTDEEDDGLHAKNKKFNCTECGKEFPKKERLVIHMRQHTGERPYACSQCDKSYTSKAALRIHQEEIHEQNWKYICSYCGRGYVCKNKFECHVRKQHTGERPFKCTHCEKTFYRKQDWQDHEDMYHQETPQQHKCDICGKTFKCLKYLIIHKKIHRLSLEERRKFKCNYCDASHTSKRSLQRHMLSHTGELPFACEKCPKRFRGRDGLKIHLLIHAGVKQFVCDVCGKAFVQKNTLDCHIRTHTGEHPYQCDICRKCFTQKSSLNCHRKRHTRHEEMISYKL